MSKVIGFSLLTLNDWLRNSRHYFIHVFPPFRRLHVSVVCVRCLCPLSASVFCVRCLRLLSGSVVCVLCLRPLSASVVCVRCLCPLSVSVVCVRCLFPLSVSVVCVRCLLPVRGIYLDLVLQHSNGNISIKSNNNI